MKSWPRPRPSDGPFRSLASNVDRWAGFDFGLGRGGHKWSFGLAWAWTAKINLARPFVSAVSFPFFARMRFGIYRRQRIISPIVPHDGDSPQRLTIHLHDLLLLILHTMVLTFAMFDLQPQSGRRSVLHGIAFPSWLGS